MTCRSRSFFGLVQGGTRLVQNQHLRLLQERARDLDQLAITQGQTSKWLRERHVKAKFGQHRPRCVVALGTSPATAVENHDIEIFTHAQSRKETELLAHQRNAAAVGIAHRAHSDRFAIEQKLSLIGHDRAGEDLQQRRFSGAVRPQQSLDFARGEIEIDTIQRRL